MEIQYFGGNCVKIVTKQVTIVVDDNLAELGAKSISHPDNISLATSQDIKTAAAKLKIDSPGEYEISGVSIQGIAARAHLDVEGERCTIFKIIANDIRVGIIGHIHPDLSEEQLEGLGQLDVLIVPVGGNGYTLDGIGALKVIRNVEPRIVIPTHYNDKGLKYPVAQTSLEDALKNMSMEVAQTTDKLKIKPADIPEATQLMVLERQ